MHQQTYDHPTARNFFGKHGMGAILERLNEVSFPAQRRKPRDSKSAPRLDPPGRGPGRRAQPGRPSVSPSPMTPGTDDNRRRRFQRVAKPPVPFGRKVPRPVAGPGFRGFKSPFKVPMKVPFWPLAIAGGVWYAYRNPYHHGNPVLPDPARWALKHGINKPETYYGPNYWEAVNRGHWASIMAYGSSGQGPGTGLITGQAITPMPMPGVITGNRTTLGWWIENESGGRYAQEAAFIKRATVQNPGYKEQLMEQLGPVVVWVPPPWFPPVGEPVEQGEPSAPPQVAPAVQYKPGTNPASSAPSVAWTPSTNGVPAPSHKRAPPGPGTKEGKARANKFLELARKTLGGWSEFNDMVKELHDALPEEYQAKSFYKGKRIDPSWKKQWNAVYQNFDKVNIPKAIVGMVKANLNDEVIGRLSKFKAPYNTAGQPPVGRTNFRPLTGG